MISPPGWILRLVEYYCPYALHETVIGDIWEQYEADFLTNGKRYANWRIIWNALRFLRPGIVLRNRNSKLKINTAMFKTNILIAFRSMAKHSFHSIINILGLALGISFLLMVYFFVSHEYGQDRFHEDSDKIYRTYQQITKTETGEVDRTIVTMPVPLAPELEQNFPAVEDAARVITSPGNIRRGSENFEEVIMMVDPSFFTLFSYPILAGNSTDPLVLKNELFLSPELSKKYFGLEDPIGQNLQVTLQDSTINFTVGGIVDPKKASSSLKFDVLIHFDYLALFLDEDFMTSYMVGIIENYLKVQPEQVSLVEEQSTEFFREKTKTRSAEGEEVSLLLQPLSDVHLNNEFGAGIAQVSNPLYAYIFLGLGLLVLVIATLNYFMLTGSHSLTRMKEFGVRKTMGAISSQLIFQLITESLVVAAISAIIAIGVTWLFLPVFNSLSGVELVFDLSIGTFLFTIGLLVGISTAAGLLSSGFLVRLKATESLKGIMKFGGSGFTRKAMVVTQFTFSVSLIVATLVFRAQMRYITGKDLGFTKEALLELSLGNVGELERSREVFQLYKNEVARKPEVGHVAAVLNDMGNPWTRFGFEQEDGTTKFSYFNLVTSDYLQTMGLELLEGRDFREGESENSIIINEAFVQEYGFEDPLNAQIPGKNFEGPHEIIGVIKDFHFSSLHEKIEPLMLTCGFGNYRSGITRLSSYNWPPIYNRIVVQSNTGDFQQLEQTLSNTWFAVSPQKPFNMTFYEDILATKYEQEQRWSKVFDYASIFSLGIAWLGLIGLTQLSVKKRIKEVGIRKVLGSSSWNVSVLLSRQFLLLTGIASVISWPIAWYGLSRWLDTFEYKIDLGLSWFVLAAAIVVGVTFLSVWLQTFKTANMNPVKSLRVD